MRKMFRVYQVNAFTNQVFSGNPAGVVANADGLSEDQMQEIARELNNSETAFIFRPSDTTHHYEVRFFTPTVEVPSCGHASISAGFIWAKENGFKKNSFIQKIAIGALPLDIINRDDKRIIYMTQGKVEMGSIIVGDLKDQLTHALGLTGNEISDDLPIQTVSTGHGKVIVPLKNRDSLNQMEPNYSALTQLSEILGQNGFFPFVFDNNKQEVLVHARMFAPNIGINEDPVTGNGNGPLGAYLVHHKAVEFDGSRLEFVSCQGEVMNRIGYAHVIVDVQKGEPHKVKVGGECIRAFKTTMILEV